MRKAYVGVAIVLSAVLVAGTTGCDQFLGTTREQADAQLADSVAAEADPADLPAGFPADVPVYGEGDIVKKTTLKYGYQVDIETDTDAVGVVDWYRAKLRAEGWEFTTDAVANGAGTLLVRNADWIMVVGAAPQDGRTRVVIEVQSRPED